MSKEQTLLDLEAQYFSDIVDSDKVSAVRHRKFCTEHKRLVELELLQSLAKEAEGSCRASMIDYYETLGECLHTRIGALEFILESGEEEEA